MNNRNSFFGKGVTYIDIFNFRRLRCPFCGSLHLRKIVHNFLQLKSWMDDRNLKNLTKHVRKGFFTDISCRDCRKDWIRSHTKDIKKFIDEVEE